MTANEKQLIKALETLLRAYESIMPGIAYIAVQDYALVNDAPIEARKAIAYIRQKRNSPIQYD